MPSFPARDSRGETEWWEALCEYPIQSFALLQGGWIHRGKYVNHLPLPLPACHALIDIVSHLFPNLCARLSGFVVNEAQPLSFSRSTRVLSFQRSKLHRAAYITPRINTIIRVSAIEPQQRENGESRIVELFLDETLGCGEHRVSWARVRIGTCRRLILGVWKN